MQVKKKLYFRTPRLFLRCECGREIELDLEYESNLQDFFITGFCDQCAIYYTDDYYGANGEYQGKIYLKE
ncbi:MAG: hypothetical protein D6736_13785 [Nitrospinota bacterium]|nr:MAG: hypothetical protein D6736_13785 [Nitrospinota bacterium]